MSLVFAQSGFPVQRESNGAEVITCPHPGATVTITTGAASVNAALPLDGAGKQYQAVRITANAACWIAFSNNGSDAVVAGTSPAILIPPNCAIDLGIPPVGFGLNAVATNIAAIQDAAAGKVCITGIY